MKRDEKNAPTRQRIIDAAMEAFSQKGCVGACLNVVCAKNGLSKGIIYHYFQDKDELYLLCVGLCFDELAEGLREAAEGLRGTVEERLQAYFGARNRLFAENPQLLGLFAGASFDPPAHLAAEIAARRTPFDGQNIAVLTQLLACEPMREGFAAEEVAQDLRLYMDSFNLCFRADFRSGRPLEALLAEHEARCRRLIDILLHGVLR